MPMNVTSGLKVVEYGCSGPCAIVLHGGPAGAGSARGLAMGIADSFRVLEPWQRGSGDQPLSVKTHIDDLHRVISEVHADRRPALVGHSWGAMLALAYAAEYPETVGAIALVGCGTFDTASRARLREVIAERENDDLREKIARLDEEIPDAGERLAKAQRLREGVYSYSAVHDLEPASENPPPFDMRAHLETWEDMIRLQADGMYPAAFSAIRSPTVMLHGGYDPHPGSMIFSTLKAYIPQLEYKEWEKCGHEPWVEEYVREEFFRYLKEWLTASTA